MWAKIVRWLLILLPLVLLVLLFAMKGKLQVFVSGMLKESADLSLKQNIDREIDSLYNYTQNKANYQMTFLEFGAKGCVACRKMEAVLEEVKNEYPGKVQVIFLNILKPENQRLMKFYGIAAIPTQVLLDEEANEYFRHTGYISFKDLRKQFENSAFDRRE